MTVSLPLKNSWSWLVATEQTVGITFLNKLATNVGMKFTLDAPAEMTCDVPSDDPEINIPYGDGDPFVAFNNRLLYGFRRENGTPPWTCRWGGLIMIPQDEATSDEPVTHLTAYDPWMWLNSIPVVNHSDGSLLGPQGLIFKATAGSTIAQQLISDAMAAVAILNPGNPNYVDYTSGHFDTTDVIDITFAQGISVGEAWTQLCETGSMDIVLTPVYDPVGRPGKVSVMNVYSLAGTVKNNAIFGWDKFPRSLVGISRLDDGTQMENVGQGYLDGKGELQATDATSIAKYGQYWVQKSVPAPATPADVALLSAADVALRKKGKRTLTVDPTPERSPDPFTEYYLGDQVIVWAGRKTAGGGISFRDALTPGVVSGGAWTNPQRVWEIPISLDGDQVETITQLLLSDANA